MRQDSPQGLGAAIRARREVLGMPQEELGRRAGYLGGAGVSISRIEADQMKPSPDRLTAIAQALGVTTEILLTDANIKSSRSSGGIDARLEEIQRVSQTLDQVLLDLEHFQSAGDRAKSDFLLRFREISTRLREAPSPTTKDALPPSHLDAEDVRNEVALQIAFTKFGVEHALSGTESGAGAKAQGTGRFAASEFVNLVSAGAYPLAQVLPLASSGSALRALQRATSLRPSLGVIALGAFAGVLSGAAALLSRSANRQLRQLEQDLTAAEARMSEIEPNLKSMRYFIPRATKLLDYIAVHAAHALSRWEAQIGPNARTWASLTEGQQDRYHAFTEIAAVLLAIGNSGLDELMDAQGSDRGRLEAVIEEVLDQSWTVVTSHV